MDSLAPACTPFKHRYDACFNSWFEGYLQPVLDQAGPSKPSQSQSSVPDLVSSVEVETEETAPVTAKKHWLLPNFGRSTRTIAGEVQAVDATVPDAEEAAFKVTRAPSPVKLKPINTAGKTKAQIKAEEYDRNCGEVWNEYRSCLHKAIEENAPLAALLDQARADHPLESQRGLEGTPWDPDTPMSEGKRK